MTCDSDDVYPPKKSQSPLYMPVDTDELYLGFCHRRLPGDAGRRAGSKHCVLPEAVELIVDRDESGYLFTVLPGQSGVDVLVNLGYRRGPGAWTQRGAIRHVEIDSGPPCQDVAPGVVEEKTMPTLDRTRFYSSSLLPWRCWLSAPSSSST